MSALFVWPAGQVCTSHCIGGRWTLNKSGNNFDVFCGFFQNTFLSNNGSIICITRSQVTSLGPNFSQLTTKVDIHWLLYNNRFDKKNHSPKIKDWLLGFYDSTRDKDDTTVGVGHSRRYCNTGYDQSQGRRPSTLKCIGPISKGDTEPNHPSEINPNSDSGSRSDGRSRRFVQYRVDQSQGQRPRSLLYLRLKTFPIDLFYKPEKWNEMGVGTSRNELLAILSKYPFSASVYHLFTFIHQMAVVAWKPSVTLVITLIIIWIWFWSHKYH